MWVFPSISAGTNKLLPLCLHGALPFTTEWPKCMIYLPFISAISHKSLTVKVCIPGLAGKIKNILNFRVTLLLKLFPCNRPYPAKLGKDDTDHWSLFIDKLPFSSNQVKVLESLPYISQLLLEEIAWFSGTLGREKFGTAFQYIQDQRLHDVTF